MKSFTRTIAGLVLAPLVLTASAASAATLHVPADYATIQAAINAASPNDIIEVEPPGGGAFYHEHITINKALDLRGHNYGVDPRHVLNRGNETVIDGDFSGDAITVTASNVKIDGFIIAHRLDENASTNGNGITLGSGVSNITITNNIIVENTIGIMANCGGTTLIKHNRLQDNSRSDFNQAFGIWADHTVDLTVEENEFHNHLDREVLRLQGGSASHSNLVFKCNEFHDNLRISTLIGVSGATVQGNTFDLNGDVNNGIGTCVAIGDNSHNIALSNNVFTNNERGVSVGGSGVTNVTVNYNSFANNNDFAVANFAYSGTLDVTNNWWDSASGPVFTGINKLHIESGQNATSSPFLTSGVDSDPNTCGFQPTLSVPTLSINDVTVTEGDTGTLTATFTVSLSAASGQTVTVDYATANGSAVSPADYTGIPTTPLTFDPGQTSKPVAVQIVGDLLDENDETFTVNLSNPTNATIADGVGLGTIVDNDAEPALSIDDVTVGEGGGTANFTVSLSAASGKTVTVDYATANGSALAPDDYTAIPITTLTFAPGQTTKPVAVTIAQDLLDEADETFAVNLSAPTNATIADGTGLGTITDDDATPTLSINDVTVGEGGGTATFTVSLSAASGRTVTVDYATANGTATAGLDYTAIPTTTLTFDPGQTTKPVAVTVLQDALDEADETFAVNLSGATNATISDAAGLGTITDDDAAPTLSINDVTVGEGGGTATFTVSLSAASGQTVTVDYATANGTATAGLDYTAIPTTTLTFDPGQTTKPVAVAILQDALDENDETFAVNLSGATNATIGDGAGLGTITDDDAEPSIAIDDVTAGEGAGTATFTVSLSAASGKTVTVDYATANGTATAGLDYTAIPTTTLTFDPGQTSKPVAVAILQDALDENDETFAVNLSGAANATIADAAGLGTITDDDAEPALSVNDVTVGEGGGTATFTVTLSAASGKTVTVDYATVNGTAIAGLDYTAIPTTTLTFDPGQTSKPVAVAILQDALDENDETFVVNLSGATNASISDAAGLGTITDDDAEPSLSINDATVTEGDAGTTTATFTVSLSAASGKTVTVDYATANGTAVAPGDYTAIPTTTLTFDPGQTTKPIAVSVNGDVLNEGNETFAVNLSGATNATISDGAGLGTITDDDGAPSLSINDVSVTEGDGGTVTATLTVSLSAASGQTVTVDYATANGTAVAPADYVAIPTTLLTFDPGQTSKPVVVTINGDLLDEIDETLTVNLSGPTNATIADGQGIVTIDDNDPAPSLTVNDVTVAEGAGTATFTVTLSAASGKTVTVDYATANGTAVSPDDYTAIPTTTLTFDPGQTSKPVLVTVAQDALDEDDETFVVNLSGPANATIADAQGVGTITDDDAAPSLSVNDVAVLEGNLGTTSANFTINLSAASGKTVTVSVATANGTAVAPGDYTAIPATTLTFTPGVTTQPVAVSVNGDVVAELDETYFVNLSGPVNAVIADAQGLGTIQNDDGAPNVVAATPAPGTCVSTVVPCATVPVTIARTDATPMRAFSVTFTLSPEIQLCAGTSSVTEGTYLSSVGSTVFLVTDLGGGSYKADCSITGLPCGPTTASGTLFNIGVTNSGADGTGTIAAGTVILRDCSNLAIAGSPGAAASILVDRTPPAVVANVGAIQVKTGNDTDGTTKINVTYVSPGDATVTEVWRHGFGGYPQYDDAGGAAPAAPAYPPSGAGWTLVPGATATSVVDETTARDVYYYVAFAKDACGNVSAVSHLTAGTLNYHLGDVSTGLATCVGENVVNTADVSYLGSHYGAVLGPASPLACLDVGPTTTATVDGRPTTDHVIDFEDLMMFALNYGTVSGPALVATTASDAAARDELLFEAPDHVDAAQVISVPVRFRGAGNVQGMSVPLTWDAAIVEPIAMESGGFVEAQNGLVLSPKPGTVDIALLGARPHGLSGEGVIAMVRFRAKAAGDPKIGVAEPHARNAANRPIALGASRAALQADRPSVTELMPVAPNPSRGNAVFAFSLASVAPVDLTIYAVDGRRVRTVARGVREPGIYRLNWDGRDEHGNDVSSGVFYVRLEAGGQRFTRTLVRMR